MNNKIVVFGSFNADITGTAPRLPGPGETVFGTGFGMGPGGKGSNQAVAAHRAGGNVIFITKIGQDLFGQMALDFYRSEGMDTRFVLKDDKRPTGTALICVNENTGQNQILVTPGASACFTDEDITAITPAIEQCDVFLAQFEADMAALYKAAAQAKKAGAKIIINPAPVRENVAELLSLADILTPNESEAEALTGIPVRDEAGAVCAAAVLHKMGVPTVIITMGSHGAFVGTATATAMMPAHAVRAVDTTGAGDAFNGALAAALAIGEKIDRAAAFANAAAALSVTRKGAAAAMPYFNEIENYVKL